MSHREIYAVEVILFHEVTKKLLLIKRTRSPFAWSTVTGGVETGEGIWQAGLREVYEETGFRLKHYYPIENVRSFYAANVDKIVKVTSFAGVVEDDTPQLNYEHSDFRWLDIETACQTVPYENQRQAMRDADDLIHERGAFPREEFPRAKLDEFYDNLRSS